MNDGKNQVPDAVVERVAKALYAVEWEAMTTNHRDGHWTYESADRRL